MSDTRGALANELEKVTTIRRRFQAQMPWLQWPIPSGPADPEEKESNPICTKSLELNSEALRVLLKHCDGGFCDIDWLVMEVCVCLCMCLGVCLRKINTKLIGSTSTNLTYRMGVPKIPYEFPLTLFGGTLYFMT